MQTVRIISHKSDRESRKWFVARIAHAYQKRADVVVPPNDGGAGKTILDYDMIGGRTAAVKIIDLDWTADVTVMPNDVFYVRAEATHDSFSDRAPTVPKQQSALYSDKLSWAMSVSTSHVWWTNGCRAENKYDAPPSNDVMWYNAPRAVAPPKRAVFINDDDAPAPWFDLIRERFGITNAVQSTRVLLAPTEWYERGVLCVGATTHE